MQSKIKIEDGTGSEVLEQLNNAFETIATDFMGSSEPETTYPGMTWIDTSGTNPVKKERNSDDSDWIILGNYIDGEFQNADRPTIETHTLTLGTSWTGVFSPYIQEVEVDGILESDNPQAGIVLSDNFETVKAQLKEFSKIYRATTTDGSIKFYAKQPTELNLTLQIKVTR